MSSCHRWAPGSIPGRRKFLFPPVFCYLVWCFRLALPRYCSPCYLFISDASWSHRLRGMRVTKGRITAMIPLRSISYSNDPSNYHYHPLLPPQNLSNSANCYIGMTSIITSLMLNQAMVLSAAAGPGHHHHHNGRSSNHANPETSRGWSTLYTTLNRVTIMCWEAQTLNFRAGKWTRRWHDFCPGNSILGWCVSNFV